MSIEVRHEEQEHRFVARVDGVDAYLLYVPLGDGRVDFASTFSPPELRGRGVAAVIVRSVLPEIPCTIDADCTDLPDVESKGHASMPVNGS